MKNYTTEYSHGRYSVVEFNWNVPRDCNRLHTYDEIDDASNAMEQLNAVIIHYSKSLSY